MNKTLDYYDRQAQEFIQATINADMSCMQRHFLTYIKRGGRILDLGCGSGRDSKMFLDAGYKVVSVDGSLQMCRAAEMLTGQEAVHSTFQAYAPSGVFDGIWACASLLHLERTEIYRVVKKLLFSLRKGGCFYMSFKYGTFSGERNGRFFTDMTEDILHVVLSGITGLELVDVAITDDVRPTRAHEKWLNAYFKRTL